MLKSSHADSEDLKILYSMLNPKYIIPVLGEYRHQFQQKNIILDYLDGSSVGINFENKLNLVYLELGTLIDDMHVTFLAKKYIDALTYINGLI